MNNGYTLVGRLKDKGIIKEGRNGKYCRMQIRVTRPFKNANGEYETDMIKITLRNDLATKLHEWCKIEDLVGVKGRIESTPNGNTILVADKLTFLASHQRAEELKDNE